MRRLTNGLRTSVYRFWGDQQGVTLAEALVALAIFGISAGIFIMTMATSTKAVMVSQNRIAAESLAKSQMENIKNQEYDDTNNPPLYTELDPADIPAGYDFIILEGKAERPSYILIQDEKVEIKDAAHLWGKSTYETANALKKESGDEKSCVAVIGSLRAWQKAIISRRPPKCSRNASSRQGA